MISIGSRRVVVRWMMQECDSNGKKPKEQQTFGIFPVDPTSQISKKRRHGENSKTSPQRPVSIPSL